MCLGRGRAAAGSYRVGVVEDQSIYEGASVAEIYEYYVEATDVGNPRENQMEAPGGEEHDHWRSRMRHSSGGWGGIVSASPYPQSLGAWHGGFLSHEGHGNLLPKLNTFQEEKTRDQYHL